MPASRKEHSHPIPTMGGISIVAGMLVALLLWFPFIAEPAQISFFFSLSVLLGLGIMDDLKDLSARYKFVIQIAVGLLIAVSGIRITSLEGLMGIYDLSPVAQYSLTVLAIVGITNAFNLVDGIDGLAGGLGFMSLVTLGIILNLNGDINTALIGFALAGGILAFLYFNFNPAKIFMGDTGSLVLGFVVSVLSIRLLQVNHTTPNPFIPNGPVFVLALTLIPVFDTFRVFALRIWKGKSPFVADRTHIHHLLTNQGFDHSFATKTICFVHAIIILEVCWLKNIRPEFLFVVLILVMILATFTLKNLSAILQKRKLAENR